MSFLSDLLGAAYKEGMTEEEISEALKTAKVGHSTPTPDVDKLKEALSRANGEAAEYKKKLREKQTDAEAAEQERKAEQERLAKENAELKRSIALAEWKSKLIGLGYTEDLAGQTAVAMVDSDLKTVIENQQTFLNTMKQTILKDQMQSTPRPGAGAGSQGIDYKSKIAEARANSDIAAVAYYTRLQAEAEASGE